MLATCYCMLIIILSNSDQYGKLFVFKINCQKSALLPLSRVMTNAPIPTSIFPFKNFTYLGKEIFALIPTIVKHNFGNTLIKIISDLDREVYAAEFSSLVSIIKLNIPPRVNFFSSMLPLPSPPQYWSKLQTAVTKFLWRGKDIKLSTMQRERQAGGLSVPNFKHYYWAFTLRPLY